MYLDPPWAEQGAGEVKRGADRHYPLMKTREMPEAIFGSGCWNPHPCAHMYMWVTNNFLADGLWLMDVLGFRYVTNVAWRKRRLATMKELEKLVELYEGDPVAALAMLHQIQDMGQIGLGQYFRGGHELLLFGVRKGAKKVTQFRSGRKDLPSVLLAERGQHSSKPDETYELIEARTLCPAPLRRLEMFARGGREGWDSWGPHAGLIPGRKGKPRMLM
jgi:N6-adenosine-specific RNA methylase IME4